MLANHEVTNYSWQGYAHGLVPQYMTGRPDQLHPFHIPYINNPPGDWIGMGIVAKMREIRKLVMSLHSKMQNILMIQIVFIKTHLVSKKLNYDSIITGCLNFH